MVIIVIFGAKVKKASIGEYLRELAQSQAVRGEQAGKEILIAIS